MHRYCPSCRAMTLHVEDGRACQAYGGCGRVWDGLPCPHPKIFRCWKCQQRKTPPAECGRCGREIGRGRELCSRCSGE